MRISFAGAIERLAGANPSPVALRIGASVDDMLYGKDDRAVSQRIAFIAFGIRILSAVIAYVSQVLLARWMGDFQYGIFVVVWVGAVILGSIACLGFQTVVLRFVPEYMERGETELLRGVLFGSRTYGFIAATFFAVAGGLGLYVFRDHLASYYLIPLYLGAVTLPMLAIGEIQEGISRAFSWADIGLWPTYIVRPILILLFMVVAIHAGAQADAVTAMGAVIAATYVTSIGQLFSLQRRINTVIPAGPKSYQPMLWIGIALPIFILEGFFNLLTNVDILIVGHFMEPDQVAIYFAAVRTLSLVHFIYFAVRVATAQRFSKYYALGDRVRLEGFIRDTVHWTFWPSLAMVILLLVLGAPLLLLFGENFGAGYPLLFILSIGLLVRASIGPAESLLPMAGQQGATALVYGGAFLLNVVLNFALVPVFGLKGAASATSISLVVETVALYWVTLSRLGIRSSIIAALLPERRIVEAR